LTVGLAASFLILRLSEIGRRSASTFKGGIEMSEDRDDNTICKVVVNEEGQYAVWPADRQADAGWSDTGKSGTKAECQEYMESVWTPMRREENGRARM